MPQKPVIFLSAVSRELKSAREFAVDTLQSCDLGVVAQDMFCAPSGDLRQALREKIDPCQGLVQLVGQQYGFEPPTHDEPFDPCSYTQYEARHGLKLKLKVWFLLLDPAYPVDDASAESARDRGLQQVWHERILGSGYLYHRIKEQRDLEIILRRIAHELNRPIITAAQSDDAFAQVQAKLDQVLAQLPQAKAEAVQAAPEEDPAVLEARTYAALEKKFGLKEGLLAVELPKLAEKLLQNPDTSHIERARALYAEKRYAEAEAAALQAKAEALAGPGFSPRAALEALELAGDCAKEQIHYAQAIEHYRAAAVFTDETRDRLEWARVHFAIASALSDSGDDHAAGGVLERVIQEQTAAVGPKDPAVLLSRLWYGTGLSKQGRAREGEQELRAVVELETEVQGPEHVDTLKARNNLGNVLYFQGQYAEAEREHRAVWAARERILGREHLDTVRSRNNLALALMPQGKYAEAEQEFKLVVAIRRRVLGPEHPETLRGRNNLATVLYHLGKFAVAEQEHRAVQVLQERVLGPEHPDVFASCYYLANVLKDQRKYPEALNFAQRAERGWQKARGTEHPDSKDATTLRERIEAALAAEKAAKEGAK
jgi:tetratricopeptide (TPR) repeat protein